MNDASPLPTGPASPGDTAKQDLTTVDQVVEHNREHAVAPERAGSPRPGRRLVIVTCMDTRLDPYKALGLAAGDAHILRNAGGIVTEDVIRSLVLSSHVLGTRELMVINHTNCGLCNLREENLVSELEDSTGRSAVSPAAFYSFSDLQANVRRQVRRVHDHPWLSALVARGFVYDVATGKLDEVDAS
ncbi:MAG: carbonic anhydrase [Phycisphaeraceae bacterium]